MLKSCLTRQVSFFFSCKSKRSCSTAFQFLSNPIRTTIDEKKLPSRTRIDKKTIESLERLSLVDFGDERGIKIVEDAIRFADQLHEVDTTNVEPLITVLENESLYLREDVVQSDVAVKELLSYAEITLEDYYVAIGGNIINSKANESEIKKAA